MVHAAFADIAASLVGDWFEGILRHLEDNNLASSKFNLLGIDGNRWFRGCGDFVLIVAQSLEAKLMLRRVAVVIDADEDEAALLIGEGTSRLDALRTKRLLQLEPLHLMPTHNVL